MDAFTGEIRLFPFNFAPQDWAYCDGSTLLIQQYPALFSVIGYAYGGTNGRDFKLPNLNGRVAIGAGAGTPANPNLSDRPVGTAVGADVTSIKPENFASHTHRVVAKSGSESSAALDTPDTQAYLAQPRNVRLYSTTAPVAGGPTLAPSMLQSAGQESAKAGTQRSTLQPFLTLAYCICLNGEYPIKPS